MKAIRMQGPSRAVLLGLLIAMAIRAWPEAAPALPATAQVTTLPAVELYGRLPAVQDVAISPDGSKLVLALSDDDGVQALRVIDADKGTSLFAARFGNSALKSERTILRDVGWADDTHPMYVQSATFSEVRSLPGYALSRVGGLRRDLWRSVIIDLTSGEQHTVTRDRDQDWALDLSGLVAPIEGDPGTGRIVTFDGPYTRNRQLSLYRVNLGSGHTQTLFTGTVQTRAIMIDGRGQAVARIDANEESNRWHLYAVNGADARALRSGQSDKGLIPGAVGLLADGSLAFIDDPDGRGRDVLYSLRTTAPAAAPAADGALASPPTTPFNVVFEHPEYDVAGAVFDPWSHAVVGVRVQTELMTQVFLAPALAEVHQQLQAMDPTASVQLRNWSRDLRRFVVYVERAGDAGGFYLFERTTRQLRRLAMAYPDITADRVGVRKAIAFPARDGTRIPAYLTLPKGRDAHNLPLIVLVHGGPTGRDGFEFDWWASFLASRGYAVVQPNFRGSGGFGTAWQEAGYRQWGELMQHDVEDASVALAKAGIADAKRVCIVGASYGGYAALAGATLTPERYRCAASVAGVADLPMMLLTLERMTGANSTSSDWWRVLIGDRGADREQLGAVSPAFHAAAVTAPILLMHGANDVIVPIEQSQRMDKALRAAGKQVRLVEFEGEDHWLSDAATRIQMLRELEGFLAEHLNNAGG